MNYKINYIKIKKLLLIIFGIIFIYFSVITFLFISDNENNKLNSFTTDGCSFFPDGTLFKKDIWLECCIEHDKQYWKGGTFEEKINSDLNLGKCVSEKGYPITGYLMKIGVKIGGTAYLPTSFRWGYGWDKFREYKKLNTEELKEINNIFKIKTMNYSKQFFDHISVQDFKKEMENPEVILIDVRTPGELPVYGKIRENQLLIDINNENFISEISKLDKTKKYAIYCWHGNRSQVARDYMREQGFLYAKDLKGGIDVWEREGEKVLK